MLCSFVFWLHTTTNSTDYCLYDQIDLIHMLQISQLDKQNIISLIIKDLEP
jgi:hypothetical protein